MIERTADGYEIERPGGACTAPARLFVAEDGSVTKGASEGCVIEGRRPAGLCAAMPRSAYTELGAHLARAAHFEAASVHAFARMARELTALSAPPALVAWALRSGLEEVRHAELMTHCARRYGGAPARVTLAAVGARSTLEIALENAVEGCVGETLAALIAAHQAGTARDPELRATMAVIASDEARHAELAWAVARWLEPQLSSQERALLAAARADALAALQRSLGTPELSETARVIAGLPSAPLAQAICDRLSALFA